VTNHISQHPSPGTNQVSEEFLNCADISIVPAAGGAACHGPCLTGVKHDKYDHSNSKARRMGTAFETNSCVMRGSRGSTRDTKNNTVHGQLHRTISPVP
jgi:hypothetical protein